MPGPYVGRVPRSTECHANADPPEWESWGGSRDAD